MSDVSSGGKPNPHLRPASEFTQAMKDRLAMRLLMRPDRQDDGSVLPETEIAWQLPAETPEQGAQRVSQLVKALAEERLIVPITVEADPDDPDHKPLDPNTSPLKTSDGPHGQTVVAFTSAEELERWEPGGRPMAIKTFRVAVAALVGEGSGTITLNPASQRRTVIPRAAVLALSGGDEWLPAWEDDELRDEVKSVASNACPGIVSVKLRPAQAYGDAPWDGGISVDLFIDPDLTMKLAGGDPSKVNALLARAMKDVGSCARLLEASQRVELVPRPVGSA